VLAEIERRQIQHVLCLGDIIGYGPNPLECMDLVMTRSRATLMGNHDFAVLYEPFNFNAGAETACYWTRRQFEADPDLERKARRWKFLGGLPVRIRTPDFIAVHASPRRPVNEYIFPTTSTRTREVRQHLRAVQPALLRRPHPRARRVPEGPDFYSPTSWTSSTS
jgi:hypothetical protein